MPIIYQKLIAREDLRRNPQVLYVFGDNAQRRGMGGQARSMRGEPNALGIPTKWKPTMEPDAFFTDERLVEIENLISDDIAVIYTALKGNRIVVWPTDGIGTGLSQLPERAPKLWAELEACRLKLEQL